MEAKLLKMCSNYKNSFFSGEVTKKIIYFLFNLIGSILKKILVTGSAGFIGSHLTELLVSKGFQVKAD